MTTLTILVATGVVYACFNTTIFYENIHTPYPKDGTFISALFFGFSSVSEGSLKYAAKNAGVLLLVLISPYPFPLPVTALVIWKQGDAGTFDRPK